MNNRHPKIFIRANTGYLTLQNIPLDKCSVNSVITILGKTRSGRSTLLNQLFHTIFPVSSGIQTLTVDSFYQYSNNNELILDVQGFGTTRPIQITQRLLFVMLMISDVVMVNSPDGHINEQEIRKLGTICGILRKVVPQRKCKLIWIVQSFGLKLEDKNGKSITEDQYLEYALEYGNNSSETSIYYRTKIKQYFTQRKCVMMAPRESPNYTINQLKKVIQSQKIIKNSIINNSQLFQPYLRNLIRQINTITNITNLTVNMQQVYQNTLIDYVQRQTKSIDFIHLLDFESQESKQIQIKQIWQNYFDIPINTQIINQVEERRENFNKNIKIQAQYQKKTQSLVQWISHKYQQPLSTLSHLKNKGSSFANKQNQTSAEQVQTNKQPLRDLTNYYTQQFLKTQNQKQQLENTHQIKNSKDQKDREIKNIQRYVSQKKSLLKNYPKLNLRQIKQSKQNKGLKNEKSLVTKKLQRAMIQQQQSYIRRLNLSKQYINRLENQQQILRKQLFYCKKQIQQKNSYLHDLQNIQVFQCWKCLQTIKNGLLNHMKICQGPIKQQIKVKIVSSQMMKGKTTFTILVKVIPSSDRKWCVKKKLIEVRQLQKYLMNKYGCEGLKTIQKNDEQSRKSSIQDFLNKCCLHPLIYHDDKFCDFMAGNSLKSESKK